MPYPHGLHAPHRAVSMVTHPRDGQGWVPYPHGHTKRHPGRGISMVTHPRGYSLITSLLLQNYPSNPDGDLYPRDVSLGWPGVIPLGGSWLYLHMPGMSYACDITCLLYHMPYVASITCLNPMVILVTRYNPCSQSRWVSLYSKYPCASVLRPLILRPPLTLWEPLLGQLPADHWLWPVVHSLLDLSSAGRVYSLSWGRPPAHWGVVLSSVSLWFT